MNKLFIFIFVLLSIVFTWWVIGYIICNNDVIIKENDTHLYVKRYSWYNKDSTIYKFHKPIKYEGEIIRKEINKRFVGIIGKGGHIHTDYIIIVQFNKTTYKFNDYKIYNSYNENEKVIVKETFYPTHDIKLYKK